MKWLLLFSVAITFLSTPTPSARAQSINEDRPFTYGTFVVTRNDAVYSMRIQLNGSINPIDPEIIQLASVDSAQYDFTGFAPNTSPTYSFAPTTVTGPGSNFFTLDNFEFPANMNTNGGGNSINKAVGSTINTSGNSMPYTDGAYSGDVLLTITYP